jgi:KDO2-lipid IV(A) lauroyltransferase
LSSDRRKKIKKTVKRVGETLLVKILVLLAVRLPRRTGLSLFTFFGTFSYRCYGKDRARAHENIARAFPGTPAIVVKAIAEGVFRSLGRNGLDSLRLTRQTQQQVLESCLITGEENLRRALARGKGVLAITGHIGAWELLGAYLSEKGYDLSVIAKRLSNDALNTMLLDLRRKHGVESHHRGNTAVAGYRTLKRGEILGMLIDQNINTDGVMVPFFGRPAWTPIGPAVFALRSGAAVVPMAIHMQSGGTHQITILPELECPPVDMPERERQELLTKDMTASIEALVRLYPQQWVWFHDRWHVRKERLENSTESGYLEMDGTA